ncbi:hypothetical protein O3Q52_17995 [Streptomyces sp. ActVer]|uniref:hypothetical protein n=1 Tax=Streptomyces sp. ActVer TaxID=3014558 RepID=UPI0022B35836|nr:hypothetical protein [Streptomyces sp. ActVer]MCZ4510050.1 hypothetical protein [Streptomyces sp. ActVer]
MTPLVGDVDDDAGQGVTSRSVCAGTADTAARTAAAQETPDETWTCIPACPHPSTGGGGDALRPVLRISRPQAVASATSPHSETYRLQPDFAQEKN